MTSTNIQDTIPPVRRFLSKLRQFAGTAGRFLLGRGPLGNLGVALSGIAAAWLFYVLLNLYENSVFAHLSHFAPISTADQQHLERESRNYRLQLPSDSEPKEGKGTHADKKKPTDKKETKPMTESQVLVLVGTADSDAYNLSASEVVRLRKILWRAACRLDSPFKSGKTDPKSVANAITYLYNGQDLKQQAPHLLSVLMANNPLALAANFVYSNPTPEPVRNRQERALALTIAFYWCWEYLGVLPVEDLVKEAQPREGLPELPRDIEAKSLVETSRAAFQEVLLALLSWADVWRVKTLPSDEQLKQYETGLRQVVKLLASERFVKADELAGRKVELSMAVRQGKPLLIVKELLQRPPLLPAAGYDNRCFSVILFPQSEGDTFLRLAIEVQPVPGEAAWYASYAAFAGPRGGTLLAEPRLFLERLGNFWTGVRPATVRLTERQIASNFLREVEPLAKRLYSRFIKLEDSADVERFVEAALVSRLSRPVARSGPFADWPEYRRMEDWTAWPRRINGGNWWGLIQFFTVVVFFAAVILCLDRYLRGRDQISHILLNNHLRAIEDLKEWLLTSHRYYRDRYSKDGDVLWRRERPYEAYFASGNPSPPQTLDETLDRGCDRVRYALVTIPNLGFLGTVIGISTAMLSMSRTTGTTLERQAAIQDMSTSLGIAFDTTFVALALNISLLLLHLLVSQCEDGWKSQLIASTSSSSSSKTKEGSPLAVESRDGTSGDPTHASSSPRRQERL